MELVNAITSPSATIDRKVPSRVVAPDSENEPEIGVPDSIRKKRAGDVADGARIGCRTSPLAKFCSLLLLLACNL